MSSNGEVGDWYRTLRREAMRAAPQSLETAVRFGRLREALLRAREKLAIYREHSDGRYNGGMEHQALMKLIDRALEE